MTSDLRTQLKQAIDAHKRQRIAAARGNAGCTGCGCDPELRTVGCRRCSDRHYKWRRRTDPAFRAREAQLHHERRAIRAEQQRARRARAKAAGSVSFPSRPAGSSLAVGSCKESPVGRRPSPVKSVSATNRQGED